MASPGSNPCILTGSALIQKGCKFTDKLILRHQIDIRHVLKTKSSEQIRRFWFNHSEKPLQISYYIQSLFFKIKNKNNKLQKSEISAVVCPWRRPPLVSRFDNSQFCDCHRRYPVITNNKNKNKKFILQYFHNKS